MEHERAGTRRRARHSAALAVTAALVFAGPGGVAAGGATAAPSEWLQSGNAGHHAGVNADETTLTRASLPRLQLLGSVRRMGTGTPVVRAGTIVVARQFRVPTRLVGYDLDTFAELWARDGLEDAGTPVADEAYTDGTYVTVTRGHVAGSDLAGVRIWRVGLADNPAPTPATVVDRTAIVVDAAGTVMAIDTKTGALRWTAAFAPGPLGSSAIGPVALSGNRVLVPRRFDADTVGVTALDLATGTQQWTSTIAGRGAPQVVVRRGLAVVIHDTGADAISRTDGHAVWSHSFISGACTADGTGVAAAARGQLIVPVTCGGPGAPTGRIVALDLSDATTRWSNRIDRPIEGAITATRDLAVANLGSGDGDDVVVFNPANGRVLRGLEVADAAGAVAIAAGRLFITSGEDLLVYGVAPPAAN